jgi:hypothetical protein
MESGGVQPYDGKGVRSPLPLALFAVLTLFLAGCGGGSEGTNTQSFEQKHGHFKPTGASPQLFFQGCSRSPRCVERAERIRTLPKNAELEADLPNVLRGEDPNSCGSFADPFESYWVSTSAHRTSCAVALRVTHALFWRTAKIRDAEGWFVLTGFPGWRCHDGQGDGYCQSHGRRALWGFSTMYRRTSQQ